MGQVKTECNSGVGCSCLVIPSRFLNKMEPFRNSRTQGFRLIVACVCQTKNLAFVLQLFQMGSNSIQKITLSFFNHTKTPSHQTKFLKRSTINNTFWGGAEHGFYLVKRKRH